MWNFTKSRSGNEAAGRHPGLREDCMLYGPISRSLRERGASSAALPEASGLDPTSSAAYISRGNAHLEAGSLERAIADYSRAIELDPQSAPAYNNRGVARAVAGEPRDAIADYDRAIDIDSKNARAYQNRGDAYRERGECEDAIADYTKAIILDPTCAEVYCGRAAAYQSRGELDLAHADHQKAIALDPDHAAAHLGVGRICAKRGSFEQAIASFSRAIKASPSLAVAYNERGHAHLGAQNFARAASDYARAMELDPAIAQELRAAEASLELRPNRPAHTPAPKPAAHDGQTIGFYDYLLKPSGYYFWLVPFDPTSFATRPPQLEAALKAALAAYRKQQPQAMLDALAEAGHDPLVDLLRGIAAMAKSSVADRAQNEAEAHLHLRAAANAGDDKARAILGTLLSSNLEGVARDVAQAREFAEQAARSNDAYAVRQLAVLLSSGALGATEPTRAADLMWTAAELGDPVANAMLAGFFHAGTGLQQDYVKAEQYLSRAADLGLTDAQNLLGDLYFRRYYKKLVDTPETGVRYFERALNAGNSSWAASRLVGLYGCDGREAPWRSFRKARDYIPRCAPYSFHSYHFTLGAVYRANCDFVTSWAHYNIARHLGSKDAVERLTQLEQLLTQKETQRALELSQTIEAELKPIPPNIVLQGPAQ
jgi:tetratricopeptide (TPR) repeat protein/TPR repeat protein